MKRGLEMASNEHGDRRKCRIAGRMRDKSTWSFLIDLVHSFCTYHNVQCNGIRYVIT